MIPDDDETITLDNEVTILVEVDDEIIILDDNKAIILGNEIIILDD